MEISKRWRIVPQLCLAFLLHAASASAAPTDLPEAPRNAEQARSLLPQLNGLNAAAMAEFERQKENCKQRVLVSNCTREVDALISRYRRDVKTLEIDARELIRLEDLRLKEAARERKPSPPAQVDSLPLRADDPDIPSRRAPKQPQAASSDSEADSAKAVALPSQKAKPGLSDQQQAQNRAEYERRIEQAKVRQQENAQKRQELEQRRARYREEQEAKAQRAEKHAQERAARNSDSADGGSKGKSNGDTPRP